MTEAPAVSAPRPSLPPWMPLLLVAVAWAAQGGVLANGWVWDDGIVVRRDADIARGFAAVPGLLTSHWGGDADDVGLYRPLVSISLAVEAGLHGTSSPFPFHLVNLFLHGLAAVLLLAVVNRLLPGRPIVSSATALLFAAHPLHTGTVSWIVARGDLLCAVFGLLAVLAWTRPRGLDAAGVALTALCVFFALLAKELAVTIPLVLWLLDAAWRREGLLGALRRRFAAYAALALPLAGWCALRFAAVGGFDGTMTNAALSGRNVFERVFVGLGALVRTVAKTFVPAGLSGDGSGDPVLASGADIPLAYALCAAAVGLVVVGLLVRLLRGKSGVADAALGLFIVLSIPVMQIVPIGAVFEDRFAYVPSLALLLLAGLAAEALARRVPRGALLAAGAAVLAAGAAASWAVAADWRDDTAFDEAVLRDRPDDVRALARLGRTHLAVAKERRELAARYPALPETEAARGALLAESARRVGEAVRLLERARSLDRGRLNATVLHTLGDAYLSLPERRFADAEAVYAECLKVKRVRLRGAWVPQSRIHSDTLDSVARADRRSMGDLLENRGIAFDGLVEREKASVAYAAAARWDPWSYLRQRKAGSKLLELKDPTAALPFLAAAAERARVEGRSSEEVERIDRDLRETREIIQTQSEEAFNAGVDASKRANGQDDALAKFEEAVQIRPNFAEAWFQAGRLVGDMRGNLRGGMDYLERALAILDTEKARPGGKDDAKLRGDIAKKLAEFRAKWGRDDEEPKKPTEPK